MPHAIISKYASLYNVLYVMVSNVLFEIHITDIILYLLYEWSLASCCTKTYLQHGRLLTHTPMPKLAVIADFIS